MTRAVLFALLAVPAAAAPLPDAERQRLAVARTFGTWTDPTAENSFRSAGPTLRVNLPGSPHRAGYAFPCVAAVPRFVRRVTGDFTAVVRVDCPPRSDGVVDGRYVAGGLAVADAAGCRAEVWRCETNHAGHRIQFGGQWWNHQGGSGSGSGEVGATGRGWVRLTRTGPFVTYGYGWDGKEAIDSERARVGWVDPVEVSLFAENTTGMAAEVTFDRYSLTQPKKEATP
ncbi:MAG: hypothetical protein U0804_05915 [Gemmataceae bacterium]